MRAETNRSANEEFPKPEMSFGAIKAALVLLTIVFTVIGLLFYFL